MRHLKLIVVILAAWVILGCGAATISSEDRGALARLPARRILIAVTSHEQFGATERKTGYWLAEVTHFYVHLEKAGFEIDIVSPKGGAPPMDERSNDLSDEINAAFVRNQRAMSKLRNTLRPDQVRPDEYAAIYFAGGHGAMWDFPSNERLSRIAAAIYERGYVVSAVCHGPAGLLNVRLSDGSYLIQDKEVTGFTNEEENIILLASDVPFLLEDELDKRSGGHFTQSVVPFTSYAVTSGRVVTGQNPGSAVVTAEAVIAALKTIAEAKGGARPR